MFIGPLMDGVLTWIADTLIVGLLDGLLAFLTGNIFTSPDVTVFPQVRALVDKSVLVVNSAYVLAVIAAGVAAIGGDSVDIQYRLKELVPRLVVGFVLSNFAVPLFTAVVEIANALTAAMVGLNAPTHEAIQIAKTHLTSAANPSVGLLALVIGLLIVGLTFGLLFGWLYRVCMLIILAGIAPLALACYCLPATAPAATWWWRTLLGCLGTATLQAIVFSTGITMLLDPSVNLPAYVGLPASETANLLFVVMLLWLTVKIPTLVKQFGGPTRTRSTGAVVIRAVAMQAVTRTLLPGRWLRTPAPRVDMSSHTHHHYRRLRRVVLNRR